MYASHRYSLAADQVTPLLKLDFDVVLEELRAGRGGRPTESGGRS